MQEAPTAHLTSYVPKILLKRFKDNPKPPSLPEESRYHGAVLFADISGFTPLTEKMCKMGLEGIEKMSLHLNAFFDNLIGENVSCFTSDLLVLIESHGGDVIKFAGDALMSVWWSNSAQNLATSVIFASQCALAMQERLKGFDAEGCPLTLHSGIGAGEISQIHVGGTNNRFEFLIAGNPLDQVSECEKRAESGQVYISHYAWSIVASENPRALLIFTSKKKKVNPKKMNDVSTSYLLVRVRAPLDLPVQAPLVKTPEMIANVVPYCPAAVSKRVGAFLAETRTINVIFINLDYTYTRGFESLQLMQNALLAMQKELYRFRGEVRQFLVDDKGSVLIGVFGLPPVSHEDDAMRAVLTSLEISKSLRNLGIQSRIGITTGDAFCGDVGNGQRREFAMVGDIVNLSARLMCACNWGEAMCDEPTFSTINTQLRASASKLRADIEFDKLKPIMVKGKTQPLQVYTPKYKGSKSASTGDQRHRALRSSASLRASAVLTRRTRLLTSVVVTRLMVGRAEEMQNFRFILQHIKEGTWKDVGPTSHKVPSVSKMVIDFSYKPARTDSEDGSKKPQGFRAARPSKPAPTTPRDTSSGRRKFHVVELSRDDKDGIQLQLGPDSPTGRSPESATIVLIPSPTDGAPVKPLDLTALPPEKPRGKDTPRKSHRDKDETKKPVKRHIKDSSKDNSTGFSTPGREVAAFDPLTMSDDATRGSPPKTETNSKRSRDSLNDTSDGGSTDRSDKSEKSTEDKPKGRSAGSDKDPRDDVAGFKLNAPKKRKDSSGEFRTRKQRPPQISEEDLALQEELRLLRAELEDHKNSQVTVKLSDIINDWKGTKNVPRNNAVVVIMAEAGHGKTLFLNRMIEESNEYFTVIQSTTYHIEELTPYFIWREIFATALAPMLSCVDPTTDALRAKITELIQLIDPRLSTYISLLNPVFPLEWESNDVVEELSEVETVQTRTILLARILKHVLKDHKTLLTLDQVQWLDTNSWAVLEAILETVDDVVVVIAMRPLVPLPIPLNGLLKHPRTRLIQFSQITQHDMLTIITHEIGATGLSAPFKKYLISKSFDSPLFAAEMARELKAGGQVELDEEKKCVLTEKGLSMVKSDTECKVNTNLKLILTAKVDRLEHNEKMVLKVASVIGSIFSTVLLHDILLLASNTLTDEKKRIVRRNDTIAVKQDFQEILEGAKKMQDEKEKNLAGCLEYFTKLDLVEPHNHNSDQDVLSYGFKNSLIRDIVYDSVLYSDKKKLHKAIYVWYERTHAGELEPFLVTMAYHADNAGSTERAIEYYQRAAQSAIQANAFQEATKCLEQALKLDSKIIEEATKPPLQNASADSTDKAKEMEKANKFRNIQLHRLLGQSYYKLGALPKSQTHLLEALSLMEGPAPEDGTEYCFPTQANEKSERSSRSTMTGGSVSGDAKLKGALPVSVGSQPVTPRSKKPKVVKAKEEKTREKNVKKQAKKLTKLKPEAKQYYLPIIETMFALTKIYYFDCQGALARYCCIQAIHLSKTETSFTQGLALAHVMLAASFESDDTLYEEYATATNKISSAVPDKSESYCILAIKQFASGVFKSSRGFWQEGKQAFNLAMKLNKQMGNQRETHEALLCLAFNAILQGNFNSIPMFEDIINAGDPQLTALSMAGKAVSFYHQKEKTKFFEAAIDIAEYYQLSTNLDSCAVLGIESVLALSCLIEGKKDASYRYLNSLMKLLEKSQPTAYFLLPMISMIPHVLFLWHIFMDPGSFSRQLLFVLNHVLAALSLYIQNCPIASTFSQLWKALNKWIEDDKISVTLHLSKAQDQADQYGMTGVSKVILWYIDKLTCNAHALSEDELFWQAM